MQKFQHGVHSSNLAINFVAASREMKGLQYDALLRNYKADPSECNVNPALQLQSISFGNATLSTKQTFSYWKDCHIACERFSLCFEGFALYYEPNAL